MKSTKYKNLQDTDKDEFYEEYLAHILQKNEAQETKKLDKERGLSPSKASRPASEPKSFT